MLLFTRLVLSLVSYWELKCFLVKVRSGFCFFSISAESKQYKSMLKWYFFYFNQDLYNSQWIQILINDSLNTTRETDFIGWTSITQMWQSSVHATPFRRHICSFFCTVHLVADAASRLFFCLSTWRPSHCKMSVLASAQRQQKDRQGKKM